MATADGPYSSIIDYDTELEKLEKKRQQQQEAQQKIARTNAVGDAFRILVDAVGGSKGATITPKPVNPGILRATQRYDDIGKENDAEQRALKNLSLNLKEKDISTKLGTDAEANKRAFEAGKQGEQNAFVAGQQDKAQKHAGEMQDKSLKNTRVLKSMDTQADLKRQELVNKGNLEKTQAAHAQALSQKGLFEVRRYDKDEDAVVSRNQVIGMLGDFKKFLEKQGKNQFTYPDLIRIVESKGKISDDNLKYLIGAYPDFFKTKLPELTGGDGNIEASNKDVFQILLDSFKGNPLPVGGGSYTGPAPAKSGKIEPLLPDKSGNTDFSSYFN
jgi:hypothetical protein